MCLKIKPLRDGLSKIYGKNEELDGLDDNQLVESAENLRRGAGDELPGDAEALVLARGPVDRACNETGNDVSACDAALEPAAAAPAPASVAEDGA